MVSDGDPLWAKAKALTDKVNAAIDMRCLSASPLQYRAVAEQEAAEQIDDEEWEYCFRDRMGWPPHVFILRCLRPPPRKDLK